MEPRLVATSYVLTFEGPFWCLLSSLMIVELTKFDMIRLSDMNMTWINGNWVIKFDTIFFCVGLELKFLTHLLEQWHDYIFFFLKLISRFFSLKLKYWSWFSLFILENYHFITKVLLIYHVSTKVCRKVHFTTKVLRRYQFTTILLRKS